MLAKILALFFRRMRAPLLVLIAAYSISICGLVLIPGLDDQNQVWRFDFFSAFYFVSFMASTIGFGEIPYEFTAVQRMWTLVAIYLTVISWLYAIGNILALIQNPIFRRVVNEWMLLRSVASMREQFFLVCGYGETGRFLVSELANRGIQSIVLDSSPEAIQDLELEFYPMSIPHLCVDASESHNLLNAGLNNDNCLGVIVLTNQDHVNLKIAIACKLLKPNVRVICGARSQDTMANLASFNTDHIINPFYTFADHLTRALHAPNSHQIYRWFVRGPGVPMEEPKPPPRGRWIICGYGRFGRAVHRYLEYEGIPTTVIDPDPEHSHAPADTVRGRGTEAVTLREANIESAVGVVAGTDDDANNLSIIMTARDLKPDLYFVGQQNRIDNRELFDAAKLDVIVQSSRIIVYHILSLITTPLLDRFLRRARHQSEKWSASLLARMRFLGNGRTPATWTVVIDQENGVALANYLNSGQTVTLAQIMRNPADRGKRLPCIALMLFRNDEEILTPPSTTPLEVGDRLLFCGRARTEQSMMWTALNARVLDYVLSGYTGPEGWLWRWLERRRLHKEVTESNGDDGEDFSEKPNP